jgi:hypothetical protein
MTMLPNHSLEPSTLRCGHHGQRDAAPKHLAVRLDIRWPSAKTPAWLSFGCQASPGTFKVRASPAL